MTIQPERTYAIEWSENQNQFHIEEVETIGTTCRDWKRIGCVKGTFNDACKWAEKWAKDNGKKEKGIGWW